jgi:hypothetical protein
MWDPLNLERTALVYPSVYQHRDRLIETSGGVRPRSIEIDCTQAVGWQFRDRSVTPDGNPDFANVDIHRRSAHVELIRGIDPNYWRFIRIADEVVGPHWREGSVATDADSEDEYK